jgi:hypothetical protein
MNDHMTAIFSIRCSACGKIHRMSSTTQPETPDQLAFEAVQAGWGYSIEHDHLILICSYPCGRDVLTRTRTTRTRERRAGGPA